jgi:hypothetical protein
MKRHHETISSAAPAHQAGHSGRFLRLLANSLNSILSAGQAEIGGNQDVMTVSP